MSLCYFVEEQFTAASAPTYLQQIVGSTWCVSAQSILRLIQGLKNTKMVKCDPHVLLPGS